MFCLGLFVFLLSKYFLPIWFNKSVDYEHARFKLVQKHVVRTKLDSYVFIL